MLDVLSKFVDRVIQLLSIREGRARLRFKLILAPAFADLEKVHSDYLATLVAVRGKLMGFDPNLIERDTLSQEWPELARRDLVLAAKKLVWERAASLQPTRRKLASLKSAFDRLKGQSHSIEREFIEAVAHYFSLSNVVTLMLTGEEGLIPHSSVYTDMIRDLNAIESELLRAWSNASFREDPIKRLLLTIDEALSLSDKYWVECVQAFQALQLHMISHATKDI